MKLGTAFRETLRHYFPQLNDWLDQLPDRRDQEAIIYPRRFLAWWGVSLFLFQLRSRRQLDFELDRRDTHVLSNLNRLANTQLKTRPVHDTLDYFLGRSRAAGFAEVRVKMLRRLLRMKALDDARLLGHFVMPVDGTGWLSFREHHCEHCLVRRHEHYTSYQHQVLEAKLLAPEGLTLSLATAFIENDDAPAEGSAAAEIWKQDCELSAFVRLAAEVKRAFPQLRLCLAGDSLYACGRVFQICADNRWSYVITFKEGHMPAVWRDYQGLLSLCPGNVRELTFQRGTQTMRQVYRWVKDLSYTDDAGRTWTFHALQCQETIADQTTTFVWLTNLDVNADNVIAIANQGGRARWQIENQGFNRQKNSGFQLEHAYSEDPEKAKAYYYLLQIAHLLLLLVENGPALRRLARELGQTPVQLFGSLKNIARRLLENLRYFAWSEPEPGMLMPELTPVPADSS
jgi:hypothetical protein